MRKGRADWRVPPRWRGILVALSLACFPIACDRGAPPAESLPPRGTSVFLIVLDAAAAAYFSPYGAPESATPNVARLARDSVVFENAYSQSATTIPSTASLLTGVRVTTHGMSPQSTEPVGFPTLAEMLAPHGYRSFGFVGNPNAGVPGLGFHRGYDAYVEVYAQPRLHENPDSEGTRMKIVFPEDLNESVFEHASQFRPSHTFALLHYLQPHVPYDPPEEFREASSSGPPGWPELLERFRRANQTGEATPETIRLLEARYRANLRYVDDGVGALLDRLERDGLYDESLIVLTADHGDAFFGHGRFGHNATLYDDMVRIPLILKFPKQDGIEPRRISNPTATVDLLPTLFEYLRLPAPERFEGDSLWPLVAGSSTALDHPEVVLSTAWRRVHAIRLGKLKYIVRGNRGMELYDLDRDADERENLIETEPEAASALHRKLASVIDLESGQSVPVGHRQPDDPELRELLEQLGYIDEAP